MVTPVHIAIGDAPFAPCGARVRGKLVEPEPSCGDDLAAATCPACKMAVAKIVRLYRRATQNKAKWSELPTFVPRFERRHKRGYEKPL